MSMSAKKRPHIAFFIHPEFADTMPTLSVISTLVRRGYRVSYVTSDRFSSVVTELGAEFLRCPYPVPESAITDADFIGALFLATKTLEHVTPFYKRNKPDLLIHDNITVSGRLLADELNISCIQASPDFSMDRHYPSKQAADFFNTIIEVERSLKRCLSPLGSFNDLLYFHRASFNIFFYPDIFQLDGNIFGANCFYAGRCSPERPFREKWRPKHTDNMPVVLVSTSTAYIQGTDYYRMCVNALAGMHWRVILSLGSNITMNDFCNLPDTFEVIQHVPQIAVLPHVDLIMCAGGQMTTVESMYHGVPMLMITHGAELEAYANNNVRLGLGRHLRRSEVNVDAIRCTLNEMSDDGALFHRVKAAQTIVRNSRGSEDVANQIDAMVC